MKQTKLDGIARTLYAGFVYSGINSENRLNLLNEFEDLESLLELAIKVGEDSTGSKEELKAWLLNWDARNEDSPQVKIYLAE